MTARPTSPPRTTRTPAYVQVTTALRQLALTHPWSTDAPLPPENQLTERFAVSRGTLRRATEELVREGLLSSEPGRGTFVVRKTQIRALIQEELRLVARPDSRWHLDVSRFVPDFAGSERCHAAVRELAAYRGARTVFVTPDNSLRDLVRLALDDGKDVLVPTYGLRRGMVLLRPEEIEPSTRPFAATLDGLERFGRVLDIPALDAVGAVDLLVTGATALTRAGLHIGGDNGYVDLEWGILAELRLVAEHTPIVAVVHPVQLVDLDLRPGPGEIGVDAIVTPDEVLTTARTFSRPPGIRWADVDERLLHDIPYLTELRRQALTPRN